MKRGRRCENPRIALPKQRRLRKLGRCPHSNKVRFRDHEEAVHVLHSAARQRKAAADKGGTCRRREVRLYECTACNGWHATSQREWGRR